MEDTANRRSAHSWPRGYRASLQEGQVTLAAVDLWLLITRRGVQGRTGNREGKSGLWTRLAGPTHFLCQGLCLPLLCYVSPASTKAPEGQRYPVLRVVPWPEVSNAPG